MRIVKEFVESAFTGISMLTLDSETGEVLAARCCLSRDLSTVFIRSSGRADKPCVLKDVTSVSWGYETWPGLPQKCAAQLEGSMVKRLIVLQHGETEVYIIESSVERAESMVTALCVLC